MTREQFDFVVEKLRARLETGVRVSIRKVAKTYTDIDITQEELQNIANLFKHERYFREKVQNGADYILQVDKQYKEYVVTFINKKPNGQWLLWGEPLHYYKRELFIGLIITLLGGIVLAIILTQLPLQSSEPPKSEPVPYHKDTK